MVFHTFTQRADRTGALRVTAPGLPLGHYRMCTMAQTAAWEPVLSPVLAHGAQNDCVHFATTILPASLSAPHPTSAGGGVAVASGPLASRIRTANA